ncbi:MAG: helix-turn-helix transcriptional regulator [Acidimicrobiales bacterium]|nr:helix-turn-helix transcriptional regulator [Acidimicrobiales bacterium]
MDAPRTARARARAELTSQILDAAHRQLVDVGPSDLSLRAIARELGMSSSAIYRYFASRDVLLTALIVQAYDAIGEAAEAAEAAVDRNDLEARWLTACRAARAWSLAHPHQYSLIYGSPVPGYAAPADTIDPAGRVGLLLARIVQDAAATGRLATTGESERAEESTSRATGVMHPQVVEAFGEVDEASVITGVAAWTSLFGTISFEMFGHYENVVTDRDAFFDDVMRRAAYQAGLRS